jgi:hypothetical protein
MKKFLLSSIIMLGVCGAVSAQSATGAKAKKNDMSAPTVGAASSTTATAAPTPQKAAIMPASDAAAIAPATTDDQAASAPAPARVKNITPATTVNAAGEVVPNDDAKRVEAKMAAAKAANAQKTGKQN